MKPSIFPWKTLFLLMAGWPAGLLAQTAPSNTKFGEVSPETFAPTVYSLDSSANAVILFDKGHVNFDKGRGQTYGFSIVYERHTRIRLLHKNAFNLATMAIAMSLKGSAGIQIESLKGSTYNLEEGKVVVTKLGKSNIFQEVTGNVQLQKMVFPNVKEGSVIEYSYRIIYPGFSYMPTWEFQGDFPILWSEYDITIPSLLEYIIEKQGYLKFTVDSTILRNQTLSVNLPGGIYGGPVNGTWSGDATERIWAIENSLPLAKRESYITSMKNYLSRIDFQLSALHMTGGERTFLSTWDQLTDELLKNPNFGLALADLNHWMTDELKKITGGAGDKAAAQANKTSLQAAQQIYRTIRDHFDCSNAEVIYLSQPLRKTWDDKKGNVADINLLLTALLQHQGFTADPVILGSRSHGRAFEAYPLLKDYNYVITRLEIGDQVWLLDASKDYLGFGQLPDLCYNGSGRVIGADHQLIPLSPDSVLEKRSTILFLSNSDSAGFSGSFSHTAGTFESMELRARLKRTRPEGFFDNLRKTMASTKTMDGEGIDSLDTAEAPVSWHYNMKYNFTTSTVYFNPVIHERMSINPFSAPERHYPVEMPYCTDYSYVANMDIPKGYRINEIPKSKRVLLDGGNSAAFEYIIAHDEEKIQMRYRLQIKKTYFSVEEYQGLRDFFALIVSKEKEQIVFSKK